MIINKWLGKYEIIFKTELVSKIWKQYVDPSKKRQNRREKQKPDM